MMKGEKSSNNHTKAAKAVVDNLNPVTETRKALQKVLMASNTRDRSKQECALLLSKTHDYVKHSSSLRFCSLSGSKSVNLEKLSDDSNKITRDSSLQETYWMREEDTNFQNACIAYELDPLAYGARKHKNHISLKHPRDTSLHEFLAFYKKDWTLAGTEFVPVFSPKFVRVPKSNAGAIYEMYCRARLLQFKPGANPDNLLEEEGETYATALKFFEKDPLCPKLLKEEFKSAKVKKRKVKGEDNGMAYEDDSDFGDDESDEDEENKDEPNDFPELYPGDITDRRNDPAMLQDLIQLHENNQNLNHLVNFQNDQLREAEENGCDSDASDLDDIDIKDFLHRFDDHDWEANWRELGLDENPEKFTEYFLPFIGHEKFEDDMKDTLKKEAKDPSIYKPSNLNGKQKKAFKILKKWTKDSLQKIKRGEEPEQLLMHINGKAGCGKLKTL